MKTLTAKRPPYVIVSNRQAFSKNTKNLSIHAKLVYILMLIGLRETKIDCGVFTNIFPQRIRRICRSLTNDDIAAAIEEIKQAGLIEYDSETGDLFVKDWWINNLIEQNPSQFVKFQKDIDRLDMSDHFRELAKMNLELVQERYNDRRKNEKGQYKAICDLVYAAKIQPEFIWSMTFVHLSIYAQLTYLTLYIGAVRDAKITGCYTNMDEYAIADMIGGDADPDKISEALGELEQSGLIRSDCYTGDLVVLDFLPQNVWATSFATYKMWLDLMGEVQIKNPEIQEIIQDALSKAEAEMFDNYDGIAEKLSTVGYVEEYDGKRITFKRNRDGVLTRTVEAIEKKEKEENTEKTKEKDTSEKTNKPLPKIVKFENKECMADLMDEWKNDEKALRDEINEAATDRVNDLENRVKDFEEFDSVDDFNLPEFEDDDLDDNTCATYNTEKINYNEQSNAEALAKIMGY